ncbi:FAD-binding domain-containing protein, partial [Zopfia rhizophila CBS 207.26]
SRLQPYCVFTPDSVEAVSGAIRLFERNECKFAIRSGGHMPKRRANNIEDGILLATTKLNQMSLHDGYVSIGPGLSWGAVFDFLRPEHLAVVGGRLAEVGVSGLILGGGLSTYSGKRGFACDNVKTFQVVVAGGEILEANESSHSDLFWALKGGSSNFGIITRFDLHTHPDYQLYTAAQSMGLEHWNELAEAIDNFTRLRSTWEGGEDMAISPKVHTNDSWSTQNGTGLTVPPALVDFANLPYNKSESTGVSVRDAADVLSRTSTPYGLRYELRVLSFRSSLDMVKGIKTIFEEEFRSIFKNVAGFSGVMEFQPITKHNIAQGSARGGNALGITEDRAPMIWLVMANSWLNAEDDEAAQAAGQRVVDRGQTLARELGLFEPFLYLNDAADNQDPIATYGEENIRKLHEVKQKYDKTGTFDRLLPGGFKLPGL